jgi:hypothetical protein
MFAIGRHPYVRDPRLEKAGVMLNSLNGEISARIFF